MPTPELFRDKIDPSIIRVEYIDGDGGCEVTLFSGPRALKRARHFVARFYGSYEDRVDELEKKADAASADKRRH